MYDDYLDYLNENVTGILVFPRSYLVYKDLNDFLSFLQLHSYSVTTYSITDNYVFFYTP